MSEIDRHSETWKAVEGFLDYREKDLLSTLRSEFCSDDETRSIRGKLALIDEIRGMTSNE